MLLLTYSVRIISKSSFLSAEIDDVLMNSVNNLTQYIIVRISELWVVDCLDNEMGFCSKCQMYIFCLFTTLSISAISSEFHKLSGIFIVGV